MESEAPTTSAFVASPGLDTLPHELLVEIAKHLVVQDSCKRPSLRSCSLASRKLLSACNQACTGLCVSGLKASRIPRLLRRFPDLTYLNLGFLFDCSENTLEAVGRLCLRLQELHVPDTCKSGDVSNGVRGGGGKGLEAVCRGCPELSVLSLPSYKGPEGALFALGSATRLRVLHLKGAANLSDAVVFHIAPKCRLVEELDLSFNNSITDAALESLGASLSQLAQLDLKHCKLVTGAGVTHIARGCPKLRTLHLGCLELNDAALVSLGRYSKDLEELCLDYGSDSQGPFGRDAFDALALGCRRLRVLSLRGSKQVDDQSLHGLARGCPSLQELDLHACSNVTDAGLRSVVAGCKRLRVLVLTGTNIGTIGLASFEGGLPHLSTLRMNGDFITDLVLHSVGRHCPALTDLHLNGCSVSDEGLQPMLRSCVKMHSLTLKSCAKVQATAFAGVHLPELVHVQMPGCGLTDQGLLDLCLAAPSLSNLTISSCPKLTALGLAEAVKSCPSLSALVVTACPQLVREDVLALTRAARPHLKLLRVSRPGSVDDEYSLKRSVAGWSLPCWARGSLVTSSSWKF